jgi:hypothetical protein
VLQIGLKAMMDAYERRLVLDSLVLHWPNKAKAAKHLDVNRTTLMMKVVKHGITEDEIRGPASTIYSLDYIEKMSALIEKHKEDRRKQEERKKQMEKRYGSE